MVALTEVIFAMTIIYSLYARDFSDMEIYMCEDVVFSGRFRKSKKSDKKGKKKTKNGEKTKNKTAKKTKKKKKKTKK